jgi:alkanesulfonate monooxygenase SsuD/methylene tetrahydromethanopterin reductase-like flavin-dependent oxidoreductase (luciferase family)
MVRPLRFGLSVVPYAAEYNSILEQVRAAEEGGLDLIGIQDHPYQRRYLDTYSLIADLLARTDRLRFFPDVTSLAMRDPPMIAKAAVSMDVMSGGRFELGLGAGNFWDAVEGMGRPKRTNRQAFAALEEAIAIIRAALDVGPEKRVVRGPGPFFPVPGYPAGPPPSHRVGIWLGVYRSRGLELTGRLADGWIPSLGYVGLDVLKRASVRVDEAAISAGRAADDITKLLNFNGVLDDVTRSETPLAGPVDHWVATLTRWATEVGTDSFILYPEGGSADQVRRFAAEVAPAVRERLGR